MDPKWPKAKKFFPWVICSFLKKEPLVSCLDGEVLCRGQGGVREHIDLYFLLSNNPSVFILVSSSLPALPPQGPLRHTRPLSDPWEHPPPVIVMNVLTTFSDFGLSIPSNPFILVIMTLIPLLMFIGLSSERGGKALVFNQLSLTRSLFHFLRNSMKKWIFFYHDVYLENGKFQWPSYSGIKNILWVYVPFSNTKKWIKKLSARETIYQARIRITKLFEY